MNNHQREEGTEDMREHPWDQGMEKKQQQVGPLWERMCLVLLELDVPGLGDTQAVLALH